MNSWVVIHKFQKANIPYLTDEKWVFTNYNSAGKSLSGTSWSWLTYAVPFRKIALRGPVWRLTLLYRLHPGPGYTTNSLDWLLARKSQEESGEKIKNLHNLDQQTCVTVYFDFFFILGCLRNDGSLECLNVLTNGNVCWDSQSGNGTFLILVMIEAALLIAHPNQRKPRAPRSWGRCSQHDKTAADVPYPIVTLRNLIITTASPRLLKHA